MTPKKLFLAAAVPAGACLALAAQAQTPPPPHRRRAGR